MPRFKIHRRSGDEFFEQGIGDIEAALRVAERMEDEVAGCSPVERNCTDGTARRAPRFQPRLHLGATEFERLGLVVRDVVGAAHEGVNGAHGVAFGPRQNAKGPIEVLRLAARHLAAEAVRGGRPRIHAPAARFGHAARSPGARRLHLAQQCSGQQHKLLATSHHGPAAQHVEVLRFDAVQDRIAPLAKQLQRGPQFVVHGDAESGTFVQNLARVLHQIAHHGAELRGKDAAFDLALDHAKVQHVLGGNIAAANLRVAHRILPEVGQLQGGADFVGELGAHLVAVTADHQHQPAHGVRRVARVLHGLVPCVVAGLHLVLAEGMQQIVEETARQVAGDDGLVQRDEDGMARLLGRVVALVEHRAPGIQQAQRGHRVAHLVAQIVGDAAEGVKAVEVRTKARGEEEGGNVEVLIVRAGKLAAPGAGLIQCGPVLRGQIFYGRAGQRVGRRGLAGR